MIDQNIDLTELKRRAKAGDIQALQELRNLGYFEKKKAEKEGYPVSHAQKRLWILNQMERGSAVYNVPGALLLQGRLQPQAFRCALEAVVRRHEALRTTLDSVDGETRQFIHDDVAVHIDEVDLTGESDAGAKAGRILLEDATRPFDLARGPLLRAKLLKLTEENHIFYFNLHHIICDEWSLDVLLKEWSEAYRSYASGAEPRFVPLRLQYKEYAAWQNEQLQQPEREQDRSYWLQKLFGELPVLNLPTDMPRPSELTHHGANFVHELKANGLEGLRRLSRLSSATLFMTLVALTKALLHRYTDQEDILVGTPIAGREHPDLEEQIGFYINTLALRDEIRGDRSFSEILSAVKQTAEEGYEHGGYPFDMLVNELNLDRNLSRSPLFDVVVVLQDGDSSRSRLQNSDTLRLSPFDFGFATAKFDLSFYYTATENGWLVTLNYNTDLFRPETIARMAGHLGRLVSGVTENPESPIGMIEMVTESEKQQLLFEFNQTSAGYPDDQTIVTLFEHQAECRPDAVAVVTSDHSLTYRELNECANRVAWRLIETEKIAPDQTVAVLLRPSGWMITALLGVLKAGAAYVPLDPSYPVERLHFMLQDCGARVLITEESCLKLAAQFAFPETDLFVLETRHVEGPASNPSRVAEPDHAAYVIYTSGSTGQPKGCIVTHRNVVRLMKNDRQYFDFNERDVWIVSHSFCFDFSVWEMYGALLYGGRVVVPEREAVRDVDRFRQLLKDHRVTVLNQTPAAFYNLIAKESAGEAHDLDEHLRYIIFGGDRLEPSYLLPWAEWYSPDRIRLINMFGITETTVHVTYHQIGRDDLLASASGSPIGIPLPETSVYVLNRQRKLQPAGVVGEIYVGGTGVSRGYLNRPELTAERFIENPYRPGERLYKSGDLGRWLPNGTLEHLGRNDDQVQVRGFRVELREIERHLLSHTAIEKALVITQRTPEGVQELIAYLVVKRPVPIEELRRHIQKTLPEYMTPAHFIELEDLPLTVNNKIDYRALPRPGAATSPEETYAPPRDRLEATLAEIWERVLNRPRIGAFDNYFNLGGDSMKVIRLINAIAAELEVRLEVKDIFRHLTIADLAAYLRRQERDCRGDGHPQSPEDMAAALKQLDALKDAIMDAPDERRLLPEGWEDFYPMSDIEQGMIFHNLFAPADGVYHDQFVFHLKDDTFDLQRLGHALTMLTQKHPIMRTSFHVTGFRQPIQVVHRDHRIDLTYEELSGDRETQKRRLQDYMAEDRKRPFDPAEAGLWRMQIFRLAETEYSLLLVFHHAILDGWSNASFFTELINTYFRLKEEPGYIPAPLKATYRDFVADQLRWKQSEEATQYWVRELDRYEHAALPFGKTGVDDSGERRAYVLRLGPELEHGVLSLARSEKISLKDTYLAAFTCLLGLLTGKPDLLFGLVTNNRPVVDDGDSILGCFLNSVPFRFALSSSCSPRQLLKSVSDKTRELKVYERFPLRKIVELVGAAHGDNGGQDGSSGRLFDVLFNFIDFHVYRELNDLGRVDIGIVKGFERTDTLLDFSVDGTLGNFSATIYYSDGIFTEQEIGRLANYYLRILESFVDNPERTLNSSCILREEAAQILQHFNQTAREYPADSTIVAIFEQQASRTPERPAVSSRGVELTYSELNARANSLAARLREEYAIQPEECVGVLLERSELTVIALLGILKAGGAYVPLDPEFPRQRIEYIVNDTGCRCIVSAGMPLKTLAGIKGIRAIDLQNLQSRGDLNRGDLNRGVPNPPPVGDGSSLAYVIYTSGSTGKPKGSLIEQRSVLRLVLDTNYITIHADDRLLQAGSVAFDASTFEIWGALLNGACIVMPEKGVLLDPSGFRQVMENEAITILFLTTSLFNQLVEADLSIFRHLRVLLAGGEKVSVRHFNEVRETYPELELMHVYGPTENTTFSTYYAVKQPYKDDVPIGSPIANSTVYVLDHNLQLLPVGVPGEICTGGDGVARGYLNDPESTAEKFVSDPFRPGGKLYRTGDLGRWLPNGTIQFIGRIDQQVKVRGFRVEPGEIKEQILRHPSVKEAFVLARSTTVGTKELIAYYTAREALADDDLRTFLMGVLPEYMIPTYLIRLEKMPIKVTGKIDHGALPSPEASLDIERSLRTEQEAPRDERERWLAQIWSQVLGREGIGIHDNYFHLGGDSIKAIQVSSRLKQIGWGLEVRDLFLHPTIAQLAPRLNRAGRIARQDAITGLMPLTPIQHWFLREHQGELHHFNQAVLLRASERLDERSVRAALQKIWEHHDALRIVFRQPEHEVHLKQLNQDAQSEVWLETLDWRDETDAETRLEAYADRLHAGLDLEHGPLMKAALCRLMDGDRLLIVSHHLVVDGVSWRILMEDLERGYRQARHGSGMELNMKTDSFLEWAEHLSRYAQTERCLKESHYWATILPAAADIPSLLRSLPMDKEDGENRYGICRSVQIDLGEEETRTLLSAVHDVYDTEIMDLMLAGLGRALKRWLGTDTALILLEGHGREPLEDQIDVSRTVGWFTAMYPFRLELRGDEVDRHIRQVKDDLRRLPNKGIGYGILKYLAPEGTASGVNFDRSPQIGFNYLGEFATGDSGNIFTLTGESPGRAISPALIRPNRLDVVGVVLEKRLRLSAVYSPQQYEAKTIECLLANFKAELLTIVKHCQEQQKKRPHSIPTGISAEDYESILRTLS